MTGTPKKFTGEKLDWLSAVSGDPFLDARAFEVAFCIVQHINHGTGAAILSDDTIGDKTGIPRRWVIRARMALKKAGWIDWQRTRTANVYWTLAGRLNVVLDHQLVLKEGRNERRARAKCDHQAVPPVAYLKSSNVPPVAQRDVPPVAIPDVPPVANIHLSGNTLDLTPSKNSLPGKGSLKGKEGEAYLVSELGEGDELRGLQVVDAIGRPRFDFLMNELRAGRLDPSAVTAARSAALLPVELAVRSACISRGELPRLSIGRAA